jgi:hypothetical protein
MPERFYAGREQELDKLITNRRRSIWPTQARIVKSTLTHIIPMKASTRSPRPAALAVRFACPAWGTPWEPKIPPHGQVGTADLDRGSGMT